MVLSQIPWNCNEFSAARDAASAGLSEILDEWPVGPPGLRGRTRLPRFDEGAQVYVEGPGRPVLMGRVPERFGHGDQLCQLHQTRGIDPEVAFEIGGIPEAAARDCLARVAYKMPFKCRFVTRRPNI